MIVIRVGRHQALFCNETGCAAGFRSDRTHNVIYPPVKVEGVLMSIEAASLACRFCAYCGAPERKSCPTCHRLVHLVKKYEDGSKLLSCRDVVAPGESGSSVTDTF